MDEFILHFPVSLRSPFSPPLVIVNDDAIIVAAHTQTVLLLHIEFYVNGVYWYYV